MRPSTVALLVAAVLAPTVGASWIDRGEVEPSTPQDVSSGQMWPEPNLGPEDRVYFNAFASFWLGGGVKANAPGTSLAPPGMLAAHATLGAWIDCNRDGVIGLADGAILEYREELLSATDLCPKPGPHRDGIMVHELRWIGPPYRTYVDNPPAGIKDPEADVWGDLGLPSDGPEKPPCAVYPLAKGTLGSTGGMIGAIDCHLGRKIAAALAGAGLGFADAERPGDDCAHPLNQDVPRFPDGGCDGEAHDGVLAEGSGRPAFSVMDCNDGSAPLVPVSGSTSTFRFGNESSTVYFNVTIQGDGGGYAYMPPVSPRVDPTGSWYDAVNDSEKAVLHSCDPTRSLAQQLIPNQERVEDDSPQGLPRDPKRWSDLTFEFSSRMIKRLGGNRPTEGMGVTPLITYSDGGWFAREVLSPPAYTGQTVRDDLQPDGPIWLTFYAVVGTATRSVALLPGGGGVYGAEACQGATSGVANGWDCDGANWWRPELGSPDYAAQRPGQGYHVRDVDCLDGHLAAGLRASLVDLSASGPCPQV